MIGMMICNDRRWPETYRVMGLQGAELVLLGYNTPSFNIHWPSPTHLRMFHITWCCRRAPTRTPLGRGGGEGGRRGRASTMIGGSCIVAPSGEIIAQALSEDDEVIVVDCDLDLCSHYTNTVFAFAQHRRIEHYGLIIERIGAIPPDERERGWTGLRMVPKP